MTPPLALVLVGPVGSGKTTLAGRLADRFDLVVVSNDCVRETVANPPRYSEAENQLVYGAAAELLSAAVSNGRHVVYDGTNLTDECRERAASAVAGADVLMLVLAADTDVVAARLADRDQERPIKGATWWSVYQSIVAEGGSARGPVLLFDPVRDLEAVMSLVARLIGVSEPELSDA